MDNEPQHLGDTLRHVDDAEPFGVGSLERGLSELIASAPAQDDARRHPPVDDSTPRTR
jgi:hypothetical protein